MTIEEKIFAGRRTTVTVDTREWREIISRV